MAEDKEKATVKKDDKPKETPQEELIEKAKEERDEFNEKVAKLFADLVEGLEKLLGDEPSDDASRGYEHLKATERWFRR